MIRGEYERETGAEGPLSEEKELELEEWRERGVSW